MQTVCILMESRRDLCEEWDIDYRMQDNPYAATIHLREGWELDVQIKAQLQEGRNVYYRSSACSLYPYVLSGDGCTFTLVTDQTKLRVTDIVFCKLQPLSEIRYPFHYAHMVVEKQEESSGKLRYSIGNASGYTIGWCYAEHIYGRLVKVKRCRNSI